MELAAVVIGGSFLIEGINFSWSLCILLCEIFLKLVELYFKPTCWISFVNLYVSKALPYSLQFNLSKKELLKKAWP